MVGEERFCSLEQGCKPCPVCNSTVRTLHAPVLQALRSAADLTERWHRSKLRRQSCCGRLRRSSILLRLIPSG